MALREVGIFDAKTHLSEYVERVAAGEEIIITKRGKEVARLVPPKTSADALRRQREEAIAGIRKIRDGYKGKPLTWAEITEMKNTGRRG